MSNPKNEKVAFVGTEKELYEEAYYQVTWEKARKLPLSERQYPTAITITILYLYVDGFRLEYRDGTPYTVPEVDDFFTEKDIDRCKTIHNFLQADEAGLKPNSKMKIVELLRLIDLMARTYDAVSSFIEKQ